MSFLILNWTLCRITWVGSLSEYLSILGWPADVTVRGVFLLGLIEVGKPTMNVGSIILLSGLWPEQTGLYTWEMD